MIVCKRGIHQMYVVAYAFCYMPNTYRLVYLNFASWCFHRKSRRENRRSPLRSRSPLRRGQSRSPMRRGQSRSPLRRGQSRSRSRERGSNRSYGNAGSSRSMAGSSLLAELSKFKKGREVVLKKEREDSRSGLCNLISISRKAYYIVFKHFKLFREAKLAKQCFYCRFVAYRSED